MVALKTRVLKTSGDGLVVPCLGKNYLHTYICMYRRTSEAVHV